MCVCVCVCVYICVCVCVCIYICVCVCVYIYMCVCVLHNPEVSLQNPPSDPVSVRCMDRQSSRDARAEAVCACVRAASPCCALHKTHASHVTVARGIRSACMRCEL